MICRMYVDPMSLRTKKHGIVMITSVVCHALGIVRVGWAVEYLFARVLLEAIAWHFEW